MSDPLGFFAGDASSSSEEEEEDEPASRQNEAAENVNNGKLPSPDTLFATVGRPSFLDNPLEGHIDWDRFVKTEEPPSEEGNVHASKGYAAIPPPSLDSDGSSISAPPVNYTEPSKGADPKLLTVSSGGETAVKVGAKRPHEESEEGKANKKVETFRHKEKRKRDMGQTSRGKSYVEEEKRVLRQSYGMDER